MRAFAVCLACAFLVMPVSTIAASAAPSAAESEAYLAANAKKDGVHVVPGIQYRVIKSGNGRQPGRWDCVTVAYRGTYTNGVEFDASPPGQPRSFNVSGVIAGWSEALQMMHVGDKWELVVPPGLAYGKSGMPQAHIPGGQTLVFTMELLKNWQTLSGDCSD